MLFAQPARLMAFAVGLLMSQQIAFAQDPAMGPADFSTHHGPISTTLINPNSDGHQLGDIRVFGFAVTDDAGAETGRLDGTLITTAIDTPNPGDEIRVSELVFNFGDGDVIVVGGSGPYFAQAPTFDANAALVRPIKGTSGRFAGMIGWCESFHLEDGSWIHSFHFTGPGGG